MAGKIETIFNNERLKVDFVINSQWETGFEGQVTLYNLSEQDIENLRLQFDFKHEITSIWDAEIQKQTGNTYLIKYPG